MLNLVRPAHSLAAASSPAATAPVRSEPAFELQETLDIEAATPRQADSSAFGANGLDGEDLVDTLNPLHHIPLVGYIYRKLSGDEIAPAARVAGGALYGGPLGAAVGLLGAAIEAQPADPAAQGDSAIADLDTGTNAPGGWIVNAARHPGLIGTTPARTANSQPAQIADTATPPRSSANSPPRPGGWIVNAAYQHRTAPAPRLDTTA